MSLMKLMAQTAIVCSIPKAIDAIESFFTPDPIEQIDKEPSPPVVDAITPGYNPENWRGESELQYTKRMLHINRSAIASNIVEQEEGLRLVDSEQQEVDDEYADSVAAQIRAEQGLGMETEKAPLVADPNLPSFSPQPDTVLATVIIPAKKDIGEAPANLSNYSSKTKTVHHKIKRKTRDTTILNTVHWDRVMLRKQQFDVRWAKVPSKDRPVLQSLCDDLNTEFGISKTIGVYARIWNGKTTRSSLPVADDVFPWEAL